MGYEFTCLCGNVLAASEEMAGSSIPCTCGRTLLVPSESAARERFAETVPVPPPEVKFQVEMPALPTLSTEIIPPTQVTLRTERGPRRGRSMEVMAALTTEAVWIQDTWQLRCLPLQSLGAIETRANGKKTDSDLWHGARRRNVGVVVSQR